MSGDEVDTLWNMRMDRLDNTAFDRSNIRYNRTWFQMRGNRLGHRFHRTNRRTDDHQIGVFDCLFGCINHTAISQFRSLCPRLRGSGGAYDFAYQTIALTPQGNRGRNKAKTDQGNTIKERHQPAPSNTLRRLSKTASLSSWVPIVTRKPSGNPYPLTWRTMMPSFRRWL